MISNDKFEEQLLFQSLDDDLNDNDVKPSGHEAQEPGATSKGKASVPAHAVSPKADTPISQVTKG